MDKKLFKETEQLLKNYNILESQIKVLKDSEKIKEKRELKDRIDIAIESLNETDKKIIELRYRNKRKLSWNQISMVTNFCESYCRKQIKIRAIKQIARIVFVDSI